MVLRHNKYSDIMKSSVFTPAHITGFFQIIDHSNPLKMGSRGAGVVLDKGVTTQVKICEGEGKCIVRIDDKYESEDTSISYKVVDLIKKKFKLENKKVFENKQIKIEHHVQVPIGTGFGVSAACALGTSLGVVKALNIPLSYNQAASIAHLAEIEMQSCLGDVIAELSGGMVLRLKEGAPGFGRVDRIIQKDSKSNDSLFIITKTLGQMETAEIIRDPNYKKNINQRGRSLLVELLKSPYSQTFLKLSRKFAEDTSLMSPEVLELVKIWEDETMGASMAMLGNTAFALSETPDTSVDGVLVSKIDPFGCRFL
jgi:pantoate kinase